MVREVREEASDIVRSDWFVACQHAFSRRSMTISPDKRPCRYQFQNCRPAGHNRPLAKTTGLHSDCHNSLDLKAYPNRQQRGGGGQLLSPRRATVFAEPFFFFKAACRFRLSNRRGVYHVYEAARSQTNGLYAGRRICGIRTN